MPRSVNSVAKRARRKKVLKQAKGYFGRRKNVWTVAKNAVDKAMLYAYRDRRNKKRTFRALWIIRINAGARHLSHWRIKMRKNEFAKSSTSATRSTVLSVRNMVVSVTTLTLSGCLTQSTVLNHLSQACHSLRR